MKKQNFLISLLCLMLLANPLYAQKLTTYTKYHDWFQTRKKIVFKTLPDGTWHGNAEYYNYAGDHMYTRTFKNGECIYHKTYFKDDSICEEATIGKVGSLNPYNIDIAIAYKSYDINKKGQRVLSFEYNLDKNTGYITKYNVFDIETNKLLYKLSFSSDSKTLRYLKYAPNGTVLIDVVYDTTNKNFQIKTLDIEGEFGKIINGVMVCNTSIEKDNYSIDEVFEQCVKYGKGKNRIYYDPKNRKKVIEYKPINPKIDIDYRTFLKEICDIELERFYVSMFDNMDLGLRYTKPGYLEKDNPYAGISKRIENWWYNSCMPIARFLYIENLDAEDYFTYIGDFSGVNATGFGTATTKYSYKADGITIIGEFKDNLPIKGTCTWHDKDGNPTKQYSGSFVNGLIEGEGEMVYMSKGSHYASYKGEFKNGEYHGNGTLSSNNGDIYEGLFENNLYHGKGVLKRKNGDLYNGEFKQGKYCGNGCLVRSNGVVYNGCFCDNLFNGFGEIRWVKGESYSGMWKNGDLEGKGVYQNEEASYNGVWWSRIPIDAMVITDKLTGDKYFVKWVNGMVNSTMTIEYSNGDKYAGTILGGSYDIGTYTFANGNSCLYTGKKVKYLNPEQKSAKKKDYTNWKINTPNISLFKAPQIPQL